MRKILIIDDEDKIRRLLSRLLSIEGYETYQAENCMQAWSVLKRESNILLVLCDVKMPDGNGVELTRQIKEKYPAIEVILLTAYGNISDGVRAIKNGAYDYLVKGDDNNKLIPIIEQALTLQSRKNKDNKQTSDDYLSNKELVHDSEGISRCYKMADKVASTDTSVLLTGETGTGKEVFARYIHAKSNRAKYDMVAINCAAFSKELLEGELFGHRAGAFTGALRDQKGLIEAADKGTLFLDEMGEMPLELQPKILRVLETGEFFRLGDTKPTKVNIRVIAATNRDLTEEVRQKRFREDLFYRISVFHIKLPSLKERKKDIPHLAACFLKNLCTEKTFSAEAMSVLTAYAWPGNVRELRNVVERSVIVAEDNEIKKEDLPLELQFEEGDISMSDGLDTHNFMMKDMEKSHIAKVLNYTQGNKSEAAQLLGIGLATLYRKIEEYELK